MSERVRFCEHGNIAEHCPPCASPDGSESAELAAIRRGDATTTYAEFHGSSVYRDRAALLRMVDELTKDREALGRKNTRIKDNMRAIERERDELRAKLSTSEQNSATWEASSHGYSRQCDALRDTVEELRGGLAAAERLVGECERTNKHLAERAVAAEEMARFLEAGNAEQLSNLAASMGMSLPGRKQ